MLRSLVVGAGDGEGGAGELLGVEAVGADLWGVLALRQDTRMGLGLVVIPKSRLVS